MPTIRAAKRTHYPPGCRLCAHRCP